MSFARVRLATNSISIASYCLGDKLHTQKYMQTSKKNKIRILQIISHLIIGLNAIAGGYYGISGAPQVPIEWLEGTPFNDYFIPSLILMLIVGGSHLLAAMLLVLKKTSAEKLSLLAGVILLIWIATQVLIIGFVSWLQPVMAISAILVIILSQSLMITTHQNNTR